MAASTLLTSAEPSLPATLTDSTRAPGATPTHLPPDEVPSPAMMPARKVPWPYPSAQDESPEKLAQAATVRLRSSATDTSRPARSGEGVTPVSSRATVE